jgi:hypothetical protein
MEVRGTCQGSAVAPAEDIQGPRGAVANKAYNLQDERHTYEKCQYVEFKKRVAKMDELREAKGGARTN